jgi:hypothetical protein
MGIFRQKISGFCELLFKNHQFFGLIDKIIVKPCAAATGTHRGETWQLKHQNRKLTSPQWRSVACSLSP